MMRTEFYCCNIFFIISCVVIMIQESQCLLINPLFIVNYGGKLGANHGKVLHNLFSSNGDYEEGDGAYKRRRNVVIRRPIKKKQKLTSPDGNELLSSNQKSGPNRQSSSSEVVDETLFTTIEFGSKNNDDKHNISLHPETKRALIEDMKFTHMTQVQERTFVPIALKKMDVLVKARTGSGKTLAFLLPTLCQILDQKQTSTTSIDVLILSPTRELASQIATVAKQLTKYHYNLPVQVMYGGTSIARDIAIFQKETPRILVATPGRILDILQQSKNGKRSKNDILSESRTNNKSLLLSQALSQNQILVLDEADRLLSPSFSKEVQQIISHLPRPKHRQSLLFSATLSMNDVNSLIQSTKQKKNNIYKNLLKDKYMTIDCCDDKHQNTIIDQNKNSKIQDSKSVGKYTVINDNVKQSYIVLPNVKQLVSFVIDIIATVTQTEQNSKVIIFFPTARFVGFFANILSSAKSPHPIKIFEMHSKKSQGFRTKTSQAFQKCRNGILLTSDVSARGVDYQDVTHVIQFGLPENRKQYIHRLGRTGRAGKEGFGLLVLFPFESKFVQKELKGLNLTRNGIMEKYLLLQSQNIKKKQLDLPVDAKSITTAQQAYVAFLGYYTDQINRTNIKSKEELVRIANEMAIHVFGLERIPALSEQMVSKMRLTDVSGIVLEEDQS